MTVFLPDISSYQAGLNLASVRADCVGVLVKCTQGSGYVNPDYAAWRSQATAAALVFVAYHYVDTSSATAQAANLAGHIGDHSVPVMFDVEQGSGGLTQLCAVIDACRARGLRPRLAYLPRWYWQQIGSPSLAPLVERGVLLVSSDYPSTRAARPAQLYPGDNAPGWAAYGGAAPALYQFTDQATEGGQRVDMNAFRGTRGQLAALLNTEDDMALTDADAAVIWNHALTHIGNDGKPDGTREAGTILGWLDYVHGSIEAAVAKVTAPQVDATALATALAANTTFVNGVAAAVVTQLAADLTKGSA